MQMAALPVRVGRIALPACPGVPFWRMGMRRGEGPPLFFCLPGSLVKGKAPGGIRPAGSGKSAFAGARSFRHAPPGFRSPAASHFPAMKFPFLPGRFSAGKGRAFHGFSGYFKGGKRGFEKGKSLGIRYVFLIPPIARRLPFDGSFGSMKSYHQGGYDGLSSHQARSSERDA